MATPAVAVPVTTTIEAAPADDAAQSPTGGRRPRGRRPGNRDVIVLPTEEPIIGIDAASIIAESAIEEPDLVGDEQIGSETGPPRERTRSRGSRGGRGRSRGGSVPIDAPEASEATLTEDEQIARALEKQGRTQLREPRQQQPRRFEGTARPAPRQNLPSTRPPMSSPAPRRDGPGGSAEALIARQNVLFEEFAQQQAQTLAAVQRAVGNMGRGGAVNAGTAASPLVLPKVGIFLDVPNLIYAAEQIGVKVHYGKLLDYLTEGRQLVRATAYAPITDDPSTRYENQRFVAPVYNNGYKIVTKPWKRFADGSMKANFDIELAVDILTMSDRLDIVVLLSGDGDFRRVCELVESKGVRVEVCSFATSTAMELRSVADQYTDINSIINLVGG